MHDGQKKKDLQLQYCIRIINDYKWSYLNVFVLNVMWGFNEHCSVSFFFIYSWFFCFSRFSRSVELFFFFLLSHFQPKHSWIVTKIAKSVSNCCSHTDTFHCGIRTMSKWLYLLWLRRWWCCRRFSFLLFCIYWIWNWRFVC